MAKTGRYCYKLKVHLLKNQIMKSLSKLHYADEVYKKLSVAHGKMKVEKMEVKKLVEKAKERGIQI